jgi:hypothetical protein
MDPTAAIGKVKTREQIRGESLALRTFAIRLLTRFSVLGSALTLTGIYGVISLSVAARLRLSRAYRNEGSHCGQNLVILKGRQAVIMIHTEWVA